MLFTAYSRLRNKDEAEKHLAIFKKLEAERKQREGELGGAATSETAAPRVP